MTQNLQRIYLEPEKIAFTNHSKIVEETNSAIQLSIKNGAYVAIASHDDPVINFSLNEISNAGMGPGIDDPRPNSNPSRIGKGPGYEFQFLMGVRGDVRRKLSNEGHLTRVYLPYGARWYEYSMRRLRILDVALHITKAVLSLDKQKSNYIDADSFDITSSPTPIKRPNCQYE